LKTRDLILVDDIISTGGSIIKATQFLKKQKCKRIYVTCTHALLMNDARKEIKKQELQVSLVQIQFQEKHQK
jgi:Phosphoribosylpyrophosphate synthetase